MSLHSFLQKVHKYSTFDIYFYLLLVFNMVYLVFKDNLTSFDYFFIIISIVGVIIEAVYIFKKTCTNIEKGKGLLSLIASINSINLSLTKFIQGFKNVLWEILLNNPNYHYLAIEDVSDNKYIIDNIKVKTHPTFESPTAYFFYNYARSPFDANRALIIN